MIKQILYEDNCRAANVEASRGVLINGVPDTLSNRVTYNLSGLHLHSERSSVTSADLHTFIRQSGLIDPVARLAWD